jgi:pyridoxamine 5'-phosphate oxidase
LTADTLHFDRLNALRTEYVHGGLLELGALPDPFAQFAVWFEQAVEAKLEEPNAMVLATAGADGAPAARVILLKGVDARGFVFFSHYTSPKSRDLRANPNAALVFFWKELQRQVRVTGRAERVSPDESDAYFASRPKESRIGAHVSAQSTVIASREVLEQRFAQLQAEFADQDPPRPASWGGWRIVPTAFEFWQGRPHRLHDRLRYTRDGHTWRLDRLAP